LVTGRSVAWRVVAGNIATLAVDAIVTAANSALAGGGGVDAAVHKAAGPELLAACRALGGCPVGSARLTPGFRLQARYVVHAVGPVWRGGQQGEARLLAGAYAASLALADAEGARSIAFPAISAGAYGYPLREAVAVGVGAIAAAVPWLKTIREVVLVGYTDAAKAAWIAALGAETGRFEPDGAGGSGVR
jgi:O-acetyl-ADP-ribose deacetylase (regulator of RNase III)